MENELLEKRIARLERTNRRLWWQVWVWRLGVLALLGAFVLVLRNTPEGIQDVIRSRSVQIVDGEGRTSASLWSRDGSTALQFFDEDQRVRASLALNRERHVGLAFTDPNGLSRVYVAVQGGWTGFSLHGTDDKQLASLAMNGVDGIPKLTLFDKDRKTTLTLAAP